MLGKFKKLQVVLFEFKSFRDDSPIRNPTGRTTIPIVIIALFGFLNRGYTILAFVLASEP